MPPCWNPVIAASCSGGRHPVLMLQLEQSPSYYSTLTHKLHWAGSLTSGEPSRN